MWWDTFVTNVLPLLQQHGAVKDATTGVKAVCLLHDLEWGMESRGPCPWFTESHCLVINGTGLISNGHEDYKTSLHSCTNKATEQAD